MNKLVIADAGPLIAFARLHQIGLLPQIFGRVLVTDIVFRECAGRSYFPECALIQEAVSKNIAHIWFAHAVFLLSGLIIIWLLGRHLIAGITELQETSAHIKRLEGLLPICTSCKKIRAEGADPKEQESWIPIEIFIGDKTDAEFTHGVCPECVKKLYGREYGQ